MALQSERGWTCSAAWILACVGAAPPASPSRFSMIAAPTWQQPRQHVQVMHIRLHVRCW